MIWWARTRTWQRILVGVGACLLLTLTLGTVLLPLPGIGATQVVAPFAMLVPLGLSTSLAYGLGSNDRILRATAIRRIRALDVILILIVLASYGLASVLIAGPDRVAVAGARNALAFVGVSLAVERFTNWGTGSLAPVIATILVAAFGGDAQGQPRWFAFILEPATDNRAAWLSAAVFVAGLCAFVSATDRKAQDG